MSNRREISDLLIPSVQPPHQHHVDLAPPRSIDQLLPLFALRGARANFFDLHGDGPAAVRSVVTHGTHLHGSVC